LKTEMLKSEKGMVLAAVVVFICILTILGFSVLGIANNEIMMTRKDANKIKAFYLAEAGLQIFTARLSNGELGSIEETAWGEGSYQLDYYSGDGNDPYAIATGTVGGQEQSIKVTVSFLAPPYECGIYAGNADGMPWTLILRGQGDPQPRGWPKSGEVGGRDIINGNIFVNGNVALYEQSSVNPAPYPNTYELNGDVNATGTVGTFDSASISGLIFEGSAPQSSPDLVGMNYATNNTHDVSQIFQDEGADENGHLPEWHELRDVFAKNPSDRANECATTAGDDFFFEPSSGFIGGTWRTAPTPLHAGDGRVYYADGDVWVHSKNGTYGFNMDGKVTIVATGDIHICDNLAYADSDSLLGLVALGKYNGSGELTSGGNIYFGDPSFGTLYIFSSMMFAANNFFYNTDSVTGNSAEPDSGFSVYGNLTALNQVTIYRDWYDKDGSGQDRAAKFDPTIGTDGAWVDADTGTLLTTNEIDSLRHYQMKLDYDDRVRTQLTQPPKLPKGVGTIFEGLRDWEEVQ
jgi:hypothetical protein